ncbi:MAG: DegT/DnrJ/EryC1/StrS family aminotransferase [Thiohalocapsa sp.]|uniref:DegT/DnrJ/EryC1/StrS family aminotransferase n=1 Tax=Thiohalocapsa sp. TaxID=2497641 RepID=UPI0025F08FD2|nr:DegT/DnrJ/EryC1/StrS family aminotransferase [Thiohalocapsa sp.]MCG6941447.1 DegT/DnrJ/EryC1/StrS family aminotransferase [Thiohalocapsa sp.]
MSRLSWWEPSFGEKEATAVAEVVRSGYVNEGPQTARFTTQVSEFLGSRFAVATNSGTVALFLALRACGVGPGDEVLVPDLTFVATANAVVLAGAEPVCVDVREQDLNIDPDLVEQTVGPATKAIVPVHVNGRPADMVALRAIAAHYELGLIEDAAQALGSRDGGAALGSIGDAAAISLAPTKIITSGQGGLVITDDEAVYERVVRLKDHGRLKRSWNHHPEHGFNFKYSDVCAAIASEQMHRLDHRLRRAQQQFRFYEQELAGLPGIRFIETDFDAGHVPLWVDAVVDDAPGLIAHLAERGIDCRPFWPAIHTQPGYRSAGPCSVAARMAQHGVWFPSGAGKDEEDLARVSSAVRQFLERRAR